MGVFNGGDNMLGHDTLGIPILNLGTILIYMFKIEKKN